ncbi:MAG: RCC1 domain-containing protein [Cytophagales bacterium]|nr:RCC1 domain-containing protein [Cytophagales bacterium]
MIIGSDYAKVAGGPRFSMAIKSDGTLWTWGSQLGDGTDLNGHVLFKFEKGKIFLEVAGGGFAQWP